MSTSNYFSVTAEDLAYLAASWQTLLSHYQHSAPLGSEAFQLLTTHYSGKRRIYHNLSHIKALLQRAESLQGDITNYPALQWAIWFHDAIYNSRKKDNEEQSAQLALKIMEDLAIPKEVQQETQQMILATKRHQADNGSADLKLFLDLDLAILAADEITYQQYQQAIRQEYWWVPRFLYRRNRRQVLMGFQARPRLYFTDKLSQQWEETAHRNLANEIASLS